MRKNYIATIKAFLGFCLNSKAHLLGYSVEYDADWETNKEYIKDIFELETGLVWTSVSPAEHKRMFMEWNNDMDAISNVEHYYDYHRDFALENMVASKHRHLCEADKLELINETIYKLLYA